MKEQIMLDENKSSAEKLKASLCTHLLTCNSVGEMHNYWRKKLNDEVSFLKAELPDEASRF
jgi:hypothetical protein